MMMTMMMMMMMTFLPPPPFRRRKARVEVGPAAALTLLGAPPGAPRPAGALMTRLSKTTLRVPPRSRRRCHADSVSLQRGHEDLWSSVILWPGEGIGPRTVGAAKACLERPWGDEDGRSCG